MKLAAIILAAGRSERFASGNKLLAELNDAPLIHHVVTAAAASPFDDIVLVTAPDGGAVTAGAGPGRWRVVVNPSFASGLSTSLQAGLQSLDVDIDGAMVILADMPRVSEQLLTALCRKFEDGGGRFIVFPLSMDGRQGNPVLWPRALFAELMTIAGDTGGKVILEAHQELHAPIVSDGNAAFLDIDTVSDLETLKRTT